MIQIQRNILLAPPNSGKTYNVMAFERRHGLQAWTYPSSRYRGLIDGDDIVRQASHWPKNWDAMALTRVWRLISHVARINPDAIILFSTCPAVPNPRPGVVVLPPLDLLEVRAKRRNRPGVDTPGNSATTLAWLTHVVQDNELPHRPSVTAALDYLHDTGVGHWSVVQGVFA